MLRPDGTEASFSPVYGKGIVGPWAASVDGNDNIWISNFSTLVGRNRGIVRLPHRALPAGREDGRRHFASKWLCRRRIAVDG